MDVYNDYELIISDSLILRFDLFMILYVDLPAVRQTDWFWVGDQALNLLFLHQTACHKLK